MYLPTVQQGEEGIISYPVSNYNLAALMEKTKFIPTVEYWTSFAYQSGYGL